MSLRQQLSFFAHAFGRFAKVYIANAVACFVNEKFVYNLILRSSLIIINSSFLKCASKLIFRSQSTPQKFFVLKQLCLSIDM